jgi:hypothetical protein
MCVYRHIHVTMHNETTVAGFCEVLQSANCSVNIAAQSITTSGDCCVVVQCTALA